MSLRNLFTVYEQVQPPKRFGDVSRFKALELPNNTFDDISVTTGSEPSSISSFEQLDIQDTMEPPFTLQGFPNNESVEDTESIKHNQYSESQNELIKIDIEDLLKQEGITSINGKKINFGSKNLRAQNASIGAPNSNHKKRDPHTGNAMARDISIVGGTVADYAEFRKVLLSNPRVVEYMSKKGWGIINEITPDILKRTRGTGAHFHFGPDTWAKRTWNEWLNNPNVAVTSSI